MIQRSFTGVTFEQWYVDYMDPDKPTQKDAYLNRGQMKETILDNIQNNDMSMNSTDYICIRIPQFILITCILKYVYIYPYF